MEGSRYFAAEEQACFLFSGPVNIIAKRVDSV